MSLRESDFAMQKIFKRTQNKFALQASLHGYKLPMIRDEEPAEKTTPEEDAAHDKYLRETQERKMKEKRLGG